MLESLVRQLKSNDPAVRIKAATTLGNSGERGAVSFLVRALVDENRHVRRAASAGLGQVWTNEAVTPLCTALNDAD
jgi:HEAT repeat protein